MRNYFTPFTVTIASPAVFTATDHNLHIDDQIIVETTGTLPTGLAVDTTYHVIRDSITTSTFKLSRSKGGDPITTTGSQAGAHTFLKINTDRLTPQNESNK